MTPLSSSATRVWRYYTVGVINSLFGYGVYALLLSMGLNMYAAQIIGHIIGVAFNYFTYRRHVIQRAARSEEHTSELQSLMRISYAVFCLKKQTQQNIQSKRNKTKK